MEDFPWDEFYERFVLNYEEFMFYYKEKELHISNGGYGGEVYIAYGNKKEGYILKDYDSPLSFLNDRPELFSHKSFKELWDGGELS